MLLRRSFILANIICCFIVVSQVAYFSFQTSSWSSLSPLPPLTSQLLSRSKEEFLISSPQPKKREEETEVLERRAVTTISTKQIPLLDLVHTQEEHHCPNDLVLVQDAIPSGHFLYNTNHSFRTTTGDDDGSRIPPVIHVTSKSRCMLPEFSKNLDRWKQFEGYAFLLHNDAAMNRLLRQYDNDDPLISHLLETLHCTTSGAELADLWRALILWEYGGIYTDIDNAPEKFDPNSLLSSSSTDHVVDAFFVVEQGGMLSQYFMAAKPRHPLMLLLLQTAIQRLRSLSPVDGHYAPYITGPGALKHAFQLFLQQQQQVPTTVENNNQSKPFRLRAGTYRGIGNYTVTVVGKASQSDEYVARNVLYKKRILYNRMNMTHFSRIRHSNAEYQHESCLQQIERLTGKQPQQTIIT